jgi:hypothetical protein
MMRKRRRWIILSSEEDKTTMDEDLPITTGGTNIKPRAAREESTPVQPPKSIATPVVDTKCCTHAIYELGNNLL